MRNIIFFVLVFLVIGCNAKKTDQSYRYDYFLKYEGDLSFPIDSTSSSISEFGSLVTLKERINDFGDKGDEFFAFVNRKRNIQFYSLKTNDLDWKVDIPRNGPNSIPQPISSFLFIGKDSLYVMAYPSPYIYRMNIHGEIREKIDQKFFNKPMEFISSTSRPFLKIGGNLYSTFYTTLPPTDKHFPLELNEIEGIVWNLDLDESLQSLKYYLPELYIKGGLFSMYYYNPSLANTKVIDL